VDAVGADVGGIREGDRVTLLGSHSYAEYDLVPASSLVLCHLPLLSFRFPGEAFACAMNIFERSQIQAGQTVAIVGVGFLGAISTSLASRASKYLLPGAISGHQIHSRRKSSGRAGIAYKKNGNRFHRLDGFSD
jgi:NADPH:quinone reductase-like Zn-dependent oxidoreductase